MLPFWALRRLLRPRRVGLVVLAGWFVGVPWLLSQRPSTLDAVQAACHDAVATNRGTTVDALRFEPGVVSFSGKSHTGAASGEVAAETGRYRYACETTVKSSWALWANAEVTGLDVTPTAAP